MLMMQRSQSTLDSENGADILEAFSIFVFACTLLYDVTCQLLTHNLSGVACKDQARAYMAAKYVLENS
jgi:hypothetical protein